MDTNGLVDSGVHRQPSSLDASRKVRGFGPNFRNSKNGYSLLHEAANTTQTAIFVYVHSGVSVNIQNFDGDTALHLAVREGNLSTSRALLMSGADLSLRNKLAQTPTDEATGSMAELLHQFRPGLVAAACKADPAAIHRLTRLWCNPQATIKGGKSALDLLSPRRTSEECACRCYNYLQDNLSTLELAHAVLADDADSVRAVLNTKTGWNANVRFRDRQGMTPLSCAVDQNNLDIVRLLVEKGRSSINIRVRRSENEAETIPLYFQALSLTSSHQLWQFLAKHADARQDSERDPSGNTAIFRAICSGKDAGFIAALLEEREGLNLTHRNMAGETPREAAERLRRGDVVRVIDEYLMNNSDRGFLIQLPLTFYGKHLIQGTNIDGQTLRDRALEGQNEVDIQATVHYSVIEKQGRRLFKHAMSGNLKAIAKRNTAIYRDKNGYTALIKAIVFNQPAATEMLVTEKPQLRLEADNSNRYPLHYAYALPAVEGRVHQQILLRDSPDEVEKCPDKDGRLPAEFTALRDTPEVLRMLEDARTLDPFGRYNEPICSPSKNPSAVDPFTLESMLMAISNDVLMMSEESAVTS